MGGDDRLHDTAAEGSYQGGEALQTGFTPATSTPTAAASTLSAPKEGTPKLFGGSIEEYVEVRQRHRRSRKSL